MYHRCEVFFSFFKSSHILNIRKSIMSSDDLKHQKIIIKIMIIKREKEKRFTINKVNMKADFLIFRLINRVLV